MCVRVRIRIGVELFVFCESGIKFDDGRFNECIALSEDGVHKIVTLDLCYDSLLLGNRLAFEVDVLLLLEESLLLVRVLKLLE